MNYEIRYEAVGIFALFVAITLGLSFYLGRRAKTSQGYFAAHGQIPWLVNGIAFAGDYLSAASFLGICGMIAFYGYDGFLYSIGYLAGWVVALFVVAEPLKRMGKFTFADALDASFGSRGIRLAVGVSTLGVSVFYLIPQMVGAGVLVEPLLGLPKYAGVLLVGATVILIVVTAGMVSTTWVQFIKGSLLVVFSLVLAVLLLLRGFEEQEGGIDGHQFQTIGPLEAGRLEEELAENKQLRGSQVIEPAGAWSGEPFVRTRDAKGIESIWKIDDTNTGQTFLREAQYVRERPSGKNIVNGYPAGVTRLHPVGTVSDLPGDKKKTGPLDPLAFFSTLDKSEVVLWENRQIREADGTVTTIYSPKPTPGSRVLRPGESPTFRGIRSENFVDKLNFLSLMLALFCGTASLPHILIRYYTVKDGASARKSTIVGIASIGFFYVLTLYLGLGAMTSGSMDVTDSNMAAPLLAKSMSTWLFAVISAIAFTTVLGTVSGLILASAGAVTHDLINNLGWKLTGHEQVRMAKIASVVVGAVAIVLGILFEGMNVSFLVGWAFSVAASANLPALLMLLFWKRITRQGIIVSVIVGMVSSLGWILLSGDTYKNVYGLDPASAIVPFSQPGIVTIPLSFATLIVVSLLTRGAGRGAR